MKAKLICDALNVEALSLEMIDLFKLVEDEPWSLEARPFTLTVTSGTRSQRRLERIANKYLAQNANA